ncbi:MAG: hypothetical protein NZ870_05110 [bacterium]|nr:hypothetical protein [bacterium]
MRIPLKRLILVLSLLFSSFLLVSLKLEDDVAVVNKYIFFILTPYDTILKLTKQVYSELPQKIKDIVENKKELIDLAALKLEVENLKKNVRFETLDFNRSVVLFRDKDAFMRYIYITGGIDRNFKKDDIVVSEYENNLHLVGLIDYVYEKYSRVEVLTSENLKAIVDLNGETGLLRGGKTLHIDFIYPDVIVTTGSVVYTSRYSQNFIYGIVVGYVNSVKNDFTKPFLDIEVKPYIKINKVYEVFVIRKK